MQGKVSVQEGGGGEGNTAVRRRGVEARRRPGVMTRRRGGGDAAARRRGGGDAAARRWRRGGAAVATRRRGGGDTVDAAVAVRRCTNMLKSLKRDGVLKSEYAHCDLVKCSGRMRTSELRIPCLMPPFFPCFVTLVDVLWMYEL
ncbi:hypothetical protein LINPERPRIM_LOCUS22320 [Linum perenne]